eukprot:2699038-Alexandrium_andersonii.AAC.1
MQQGEGRGHPIMSGLLSVDQAATETKAENAPREVLTLFVPSPKLLGGETRLGFGNEPPID